MRTGGAVVAARDLRQPLRAGGAAGGLPVTLVVGLTHDLRQPLRQTRLLLTDQPHLTTTRLAPPLQHLIDRPLQCGEHMFVSYQPHHPANVPSLCRNPAILNCQGQPRRDHATEGHGGATKRLERGVVAPPPRSPTICVAETAAARLSGVRRDRVPRPHRQSGPALAPRLAGEIGFVELRADAGHRLWPASISSLRPRRTPRATALRSACENRHRPPAVFRGWVARSAQVHRKVPLPPRHARTSRPVVGEGPVL